MYHKTHSTVNPEGVDSDTLGVDSETSGVDSETLGVDSKTSGVDSETLESTLRHSFSLFTGFLKSILYLIIYPRT